MRSTFKILFYIDKREVRRNEDGTTAVLCRITIDGKAAAINTGCNVKPEEWDSTKDNRKLQYFRENVELRYAKLLASNGVVSADLLKNEISGVNALPEHLLQGGEDELERLRLRSIEINSKSTHRESNNSQRSLREYLATRGLRDIHFRDITEEFAESYRLFLKATKVYKNAQVNVCLKWLNRLIYIAVDREILKFNPLYNVQYEKRDPPKLKHITREQLRKIMSTPLADEFPELARRMFIFCSFCGLSYADMQNLYPSDVGTTSEGRKYIRSKRIKTKEEAFIPLHPIAEKIMSLYNVDDDSKPIFPHKNRDSICREIHELGIIAGIKENLSPHQARHCFGTQLISAGVPMESVSKMLGHANISSTQVYAKITDDKISKDMDMLIEKRKQQQI